MREWALITFTLCMQAAVGASILYALLRQKKPEFDLKKGFNLLLGLVIIGMLASLLHLGKPHLAITSLFNPISSWLSREIFLSGAYFVLLLLAWYVERKGKASNGLLWLLSLVGVLAVFSMAQLYRVTMIPAWQSWYTVADFFGTTFILGSLVFMLSTGTEGKVLRPDRVILGAALLQIILLPSFLSGLSAGIPAAQSSAGLFAGPYSVVNSIRWALVLGGVFLVTLFHGQRQKLIPAGLILAVGLLIGRYLFYATGILIDVGMM